MLRLATFVAISVFSLSFPLYGQDRKLDRAQIEKFVSAIGATFTLVETAVPSIGCPQDGQGGSEPAPQLPAKTVLLPKEFASLVAYYSSSDNGDYGVIGPRGWSCFGIYGSSGSRLYVVPNSISGSILDRPQKIGGGQAIVLIGLNGETYGRFGMAKIAARIFPRARAFAEKVKAEQFDDPAEYVFDPWPEDNVIRLSDFTASYVTPPSVLGLGTMYGPMPGSDPIKGLVFLNLDSGSGGPYLVKLAVRLPETIADLYPAIAIAQLAAHSRESRTELLHCYLSVEGVTYMDHTCTVRREAGIVSIGEGATDRYNAHLPEEDKKMGFWNGRDGGTRTNESLGNLQRRGDCWLNFEKSTRICVFAIPAKTNAKTQSNSEKQNLERNPIRLFPLASCKGPNATLISSTGVNSANARIEGIFKEANIKEYCERMIVDNAERLRACVLEMERTIGQRFFAAANCGRHVITSIRNAKRDTLELRIKGVSKVRVVDRDQESVDWEMRSLVSGETFGSVCAYGTPPIAEQFQLLCPSEWSNMINQARSKSSGETLRSNAGSQSLSYIGKWYDDDPSVCKNKPGEANKTGNFATDYTATRVFGHESNCKITNATSRGNATELSLLCNGEGMTYKERQLVTVVDGHLEVSYVANGRKTTDKYSRCP